MWFDEPADASAISVPMDMQVMLSLNGVMVVLLGVLPGPLLGACIHAMTKTLGT
jgi:NADH-quinone oxidoreductase subunit N